MSVRDLYLIETEYPNLMKTRGAEQGGDGIHKDDGGGVHGASSPGSDDNMANMAAEVTAGTDIRVLTLTLTLVLMER